VSRVFTFDSVSADEAREFRAALEFAAITALQEVPVGQNVTVKFTTDEAARIAAYRRAIRAGMFNEGSR
jgi:hypothetical protein